MKASDIKSMDILRGAIAGWPASGAPTVSPISFVGNGVMGYDCGIPQYPYATDLPSEEEPYNEGKRVLLGDMNKVIQLVSVGLYLRKLGASNEFDDRVVNIDKGAKGESEDYGYPNGAVIDWWDGSTFRKVICVKSGSGVDNGNCKVGPDDAVHGVEGSGTKYWELVDYEPIRKYKYVETGWNDEDAIKNNVFQRYCLLSFIWQYQQENNHGDNNVSMYGYVTTGPIYVKKGDVLAVSSNSFTINGSTFRMTNKDVINTPSYNYIKNMGIYSSSISKLVEDTE